MSIRRSDIEKALDEFTSNFEGIRFQRLAVMLAKQRFPDLVASEPMQDLGADAVGSGKVLICSLTAALPKLRSEPWRVVAAGCENVCTSLRVRPGPQVNSFQR